MSNKQYTITFDNGIDAPLVIGSGTPYGIISTEGFDGKNIDVEVDEYQFDGGKIRKQRIATRDMSIGFDYSGDDIATQDCVEGLFSPHKPGILRVNNQGRERSIGYVPTYIGDKRENLYHNLEFEVQLKGPYGWFADADYHLVELTSWVGGFTLPTQLPFSLRHRGVAKQLVKNEGHAYAPVWVQFKGPANNPKVTNETTGVHVQIGATLTADQTLHIKTDTNTPTVEIEENGVFTNAYPLLAFGSKMSFGLAIGDNVLRYETADANQVNQVNVLYKNLYMGA
ncbi:phage distal tail protein [Eubacterium sp.]|uniref:phage distal tail protein n=1 Tax=Eubacterium sp. TaxID=142586 RepID=UPI002FC5CC19